MADLNVLWADFLNGAGHMVIGFGLLLLASAAMALFLDRFTRPAPSKRAAALA